MIKTKPPPFVESKFFYGEILKNILMISKNKLVFNVFFDKLKNPINFIDIGARGGLESPWSFFNSGTLKVIGFEPDQNEANTLSTRYPERKYYASGLWSYPCMQKYYLCKSTPMSSMFQPNQEGNIFF